MNSGISLICLSVHVVVYVSTMQTACSLIYMFVQIDITAADDTGLRMYKESDKYDTQVLVLKPVSGLKKCSRFSSRLDTFV